MLRTAQHMPVLHPPVKPSPAMSRTMAILQETGYLTTTVGADEGVVPRVRTVPGLYWAIMLVAVGCVVAFVLAART